MPTDAAITRAFIHVNIFRRELVTKFAVSLVSVFRASFAIPLFEIMTTSFCSITDSTGPLSFENIGILKSVFMTLRAMGLKRLIFSSVPASNVLFVNNSLEMARIAAFGILAKVVNFFVFGDRPNQHFVNDSVSAPGFPADRNVTVSKSVFAGCCAHPQPTVGCWVNVGICFDAIWKIGELDHV